MSDQPSGKRGKEPEGYIGIKDHGPAHRVDGARRMLASAVWGGIPVAVTSEHAIACDYCGSAWPNSVCMGADTHPGLDIAIVRGTPLFAAAAGTVEFAGWGEYYRPHHVDIRTPTGELHIYAHMWSVDPAVVVHGQVRAGQFLGTSGEQTIAGTMTPDGTGAHLHIETRGGDGCAFSPEATLVDAVSVGGQAPPPPPSTSTSSSSSTVLPTPVPTDFAIKDRIRVVAGPLELRSAAGLAGAVLATLENGTELRVSGGPEKADGFAWYEVREPHGTNRGWVAGQFCAFIGRPDR